MLLVSSRHSHACLSKTMPYFCRTFWWPEAQVLDLWWVVLVSNQWPLPCETEVGCLRIKDMRVGPPTATRTWCHLISLDITQCHGRTVPKLSQRSFSRVSCLPRAGSNRGQDFASVYHRPAFS